MPKCRVTIANDIPPAKNVLIIEMLSTFSYREEDGHTVPDQSIRKRTTLTTGQSDFVAAPLASQCVWKTVVRLIVNLGNGKFGVTKPYVKTSETCERKLNLRLTLSGIAGLSLEEQLVLIEKTDSGETGRGRTLQIMMAAVRTYHSKRSIRLAIGTSESVGISTYDLGDLNAGDDHFSTVTLPAGGISAAYLFWTEKGHRKGLDFQLQSQTAARLFCQFRGISLNGKKFDYEWFGASDVPAMPVDLENCSDVEALFPQIDSAEQP